MNDDVDEAAERVALEHMYADLNVSVHDAVADVLDHLDGHLLAGRMAACDHYLSLVDADRIAAYPVLMVSILMVTLRVARHLPSRAGLCERMRAAVCHTSGVESANVLAQYFRVP